MASNNTGNTASNQIQYTNQIPDHGAEPWQYVENYSSMCAFTKKKNKN